jgi:hypothetical protein
VAHDAVEFKQAAAGAFVALWVGDNTAAILDLIAGIVKLFLGEITLVEALIAVVAFHLWGQLDVPETRVRQFTLGVASCAALTARDLAGMDRSQSRSQSFVASLGL